MTDSRAAGTTIGALLDALGVRMRLEAGQQLVEVVVVGKVVDFTDARASTAMVLSASPGLDWIGQRGLLAVGQDVLIADIQRAETD